MTSVMSPSKPLHPQSLSLSPTSTSSKTSGKPFYDLNEVFNQLSNVKSASISAPDSKIRLTPRSKIACLSQGVNPELLRRRDKSSFSVPGVDPEIQRLMHEAYDRRRIELMGVACAERKKIIEIRETKDGQNASASNEKSHTYLTPADILAREEHVTSTLIETEKQRLEKMKERQKKKLLQKIKYEVYMQEAETAMREKEQINAKLAEAESKEREDRKRKEAEGRRIQEISRQAEEQEVEERKRQLAQKDYEREQNISKQREDQRIANKMRARILDDERREKQQKQRNETDRKINDIRIEILKKGTERELKDRQHALKVEARRNVEKAASAHRRKEILKRQSANKDAALCAEEKRKDDLKEKQCHHEKAQRLLQLERDMAILMRKDLNEKREQKRLMLLDTSRKSKEMEMESLRKKFEEEGMQVAHIQEDREKQSLISKAKRKLAQQLKAENIERMKRKEDYEREVTECKLNEDAKRIEDMLKKKENILTQRRIEAVQTKRKKDEIINIIEQANLIGGKNVVKLLSNLDDSQKMSKEVSSTCRPASSPNSAHRGRDQIESMKTKMVASRTARDTDHNMAARSPNVPPVTEIRMRSSECSVLENQQQKTVFSRSTRKNQQYSKQAQNLSPSPYSKTMVLWSS